MGGPRISRAKEGSILIGASPEEEIVACIAEVTAEGEYPSSIRSNAVRTNAKAACGL